MKKRELNLRFRHEEVSETEFNERKNRLIKLLGDEIIKNEFGILKDDI